MGRKLNILFAASEGVPFVKTGGLGDVIGALPGTLARRGHTVAVILPYYRAIRKRGFDIHDTGKRISVPVSNRTEKASIYKTSLDEVQYYLIGKESYYDREGLYVTETGDYPDNAERFIFFSRAVLAAAQAVGFRPDIVHVNDWQTGLVPIYLKMQTNGSRESFFRNTRVVFTIHNLAYQGLYWHHDMHLTNLPWELFSIEGFEFYGKISLLKAGIVGADIVTTVSKKYSQEIQTEEFGCGLEGVLRTRSDALCGVLNGVDYNEWNPKIDKYIVAHYSAKDISGKLLCKKDVLKEYGIKNALRYPVIGLISRLTSQKGMDILSDAIERILKAGAVMLILGTGEEKYHELLRDSAGRYPGKLGLRIDFNNALAHKIEAGSDFFLMPSRYEPCGLNQMYSLRYGTIPIVRATGGLDDTIIDYNPGTGRGNGFKFTEYTSDALVRKVEEALRVFRNKQRWQALVEKAMKCDYSWNKSAQEYEQVYDSVLKKDCASIGKGKLFFSDAAKQS